MPEVIKNSENLLFINPEMVENIKEEARKSSSLIARLLMHLSHEDPVQEMLIAMCRGCAVAPNRALGRSESLQVVEGEIMLIMFDENGEVIQRVEMGSPGSDKAFLYRFTSTPWHTMVPLTEMVMVHETLQGPFVQSSETPPEWIPQDPTELKNLLNQAAVRS
jgi:cupin fold WbuC family metalloprotein